MCTGAHAFAPVPNGAKVEIRSDFAGQQVENVIWVVKEEPFTGADCSELAAAIAGWYTGQFLPNVANTVIGEDIVVTAWDSDHGAQVHDTSISGVAGGGSGAALPNNVALAVHLGTDFRGRSYQGRVYHFGIMDSGVTGNVVHPDFMTSITDIWQALKDAIEGLGAEWKWNVVSFCGHGVWRTEGVATPVISVAPKDNIVDSQRRRLPGRGR